MTRHVLTLNSGSSSIKFALFEPGAEPVEKLRGQVDGLGSHPQISAAGDCIETVESDLDPAAGDHEGALSAILDLLEEAIHGIEILSVGHRIVHGGTGYGEPVVLDRDILMVPKGFSDGFDA